MIAHISDDGLNREESVAEHTQKITFLCNEKGIRCGLSQMMSLCGALHDMGKNKQTFDNYLHADEKTKRKLRGTIAHASTGAKYIYDIYHDNSDKIKLMVEIISYAVAAHHGLFDCVDIEHTDIFTRKLSNIDDYEEACYNANQDYLSEYELDKIFTDALKEFDLVWGKIKEILVKLKQMLLSRYNKSAKEMLFDCRFFLLACLQRLVLSILIDSDWEATSDFMDNVDTLSKSSKFNFKKIFKEARENFEIYMKEKQQSITAFQLTGKEKEIFNARNTLQNECIQFAKNPTGIYCLPIPTGGGKTLSSLIYA